LIGERFKALIDQDLDLDRRMLATASTTSSAPPYGWLGPRGFDASIRGSTTSDEAAPAAAEVGR
jgi:hypothetical protein